MAKRNNRRNRQSAPNRAILMVIIALIAGGTIFLMLSASDTGSAPPVVESRLELDPVLGSPEAPVTIIEYGSYGCSACRAWHQAGIIDQILAAYPDQVRFVFRDFPVIYPAYDRMAAEVAHCALDQGQDSFWQLHDALYSTIQPRSSQDDILRTGEQLGLNGDALRECVDQNTHRGTVQYHEDRARSLGLPGTPSFLVNDARLFNATPDALLAAVEQALASS
jgi:protein-disulfide isomerase